MSPILDVNTVLFTVMGYPMSPIEFFGTLLNLWCVWLATKNKVLSWPIGIVAVVLFFLLFYQIRLYSDMVEQAYFFVTGFWGWYLWTHPKRAKDAVGAGPKADGGKADGGKKELKVSRASSRENAISVAVTVVGTLALGAFMAKVHLLLPSIFAVPADFPYTDAFTTVLSFVATALMMRRKVECWYLWILVDIIGVWLYFVKGVRFISLEYLLFLMMATNGLFQWRRILRGMAPGAKPLAQHAG